MTSGHKAGNELRHVVTTPDESRAGTGKTRGGEHAPDIEEQGECERQKDFPEEDSGCLQPTVTRDREGNEPGQQSDKSGVRVAPSRC
jgi:hypothetical protein